MDLLINHAVAMGAVEFVYSNNIAGVSRSSLPAVMREIPQCWLTGHAAGAGAAVAANRAVQPRDFDVNEVRTLLRSQGAHLSDDAAVAAARAEAEVAQAL
jgi:hypothetical protein